jgi:hypothetical protein
VNKLRGTIQKFFHQSKTIIILASAGLVIVLFWPVTYISQIYHDHYDPVNNTVSQLLIGPGGNIEQAAFFIAGIFIIAFIIGLNACIRPPKKVTFYAGLVLMVIMGLAVSAMAFAPPESTHFSGMRHVVLAAAAVVSFPVACLFLVWQFRREGWRNITAYTWLAGLTGIALCAGDVLTPDRWLGLVERLLIANGMLWFGVVGLFMIYRVLKLGLKTA